MRDTKYLRKLINNQRKKNYTNYEEVLHEFPGKTVELLRKEYNKKFYNSSKITNNKEWSKK